MDTLVQWDHFDQGGIGLSTDAEIAGRGVMFLVVDYVAAERRRLQNLGIALGDECWQHHPRGPIRRHDRAGTSGRGGMC
jgi:hypothetical protein